MKKSAYHHLRKKWVKKHNEVHEKLLNSHKDILDQLNAKQHIIGALMLATSPFLSITPIINHAIESYAYVNQKPHQPVTNSTLVSELKKTLPPDVRPLTPSEDQALAATLSATMHINVTPELQGIRLNTTYGIIGKEQHLRRYPGDTIYQHIDTNSTLPVSDGVAPGLGAWGYFAPSQAQITQEDILREKYYIAVQTFLSPGWEQNVGRYGLFFKYRKMLVVNPDNGKALVADIADAGPSPLTGKQLGGSPEVMQYLDRVDGAQRGPVLYFFIDDPGDTIPLGPVQYETVFP